jgi:hypothetical protein
MPEKSWKDNHMFVSLAMITLVAGSITAIGTISGAYDAGHTSEAELKVVQNAVEEYAVAANCNALSIQISLAEQAIWQMEQAGDNSQRLLEKRRELRDMLAKYRKLECATKI